MEGRRADVFLSYSRADSTVAERLATRLRGSASIRGSTDGSWRVGGRWQDEIAGALNGATACAVFVGPEGLGDWAREELGVAQDRAAKDRTSCSRSSCPVRPIRWIRASPS